MLALVLTWTLVSPVAAEESPEAGSAETEILAVDELVPPLESEVLDTTVDPAVWGRFDSSEPSIVAPELTRAVGGAVAGNDALDGESSYDPDSSELLVQDEFSNTYANPDGSRTTELSNAPLNARDEGVWVPVSTLVERQADASWSTGEHPLDPTFAATADAEDAFSISRGGYEIGFTLVGADSSSVELPAATRFATTTDQIVYEEV